MKGEAEEQSNVTISQVLRAMVVYWVGARESCREETEKMQTSMINVTCLGGLTGYSTLGHFNAISKTEIDSPWVERGKGLSGRYTP